MVFLFFSFRLSFACSPQNLRAVKFNDRNQAVGELQSCLNKLGFSIKGGVTNFFGKETQQALEKFYKQMLGINVDGKNFGPKGLNWFKSNYRKLLTKKSEKFLVRVSSKEELKNKLAESITYYDYLTFGQTPSLPRTFVHGIVTEEASKRYGETNVQVKGIDEPDIVKNDGFRIYFTNERSIPVKEEGNLIGWKSTVNIINAFPLKDLSLLANITLEGKELAGNLLLDKENKVLIVFGYGFIKAYSIIDPAKPEKIWDYEYANMTDLLTARFYQGKIYLFLRTYLNKKDPCPVVILNRFQNPLSLACFDFYIPVNPIVNDYSYSVFILDPKTGNVDKKVSFIGSLDNSVIYVSPKNIYLTYSYYENLNSYILDFFSNQLTDILPIDIVNKIIKLKDYDISDEAKIFEIKLIFNKYLNSLSDGEKVSLKINSRLQDYLVKNLKNLEKTAIVKIDINNLEIKKIGYVPGILLNQFSLDENNDYLRLAVTIAERGFSFGPIWINVTSSNAVYVLDSDLNIIGGVENLGLTERIYSVRFYGDRGYLVTFRQTDPFYVLDLTDPQTPRLKGELKIPGYSSYLEELDNNLILGIGQEDLKVKMSLFDVSNASNPIEVDKYFLEDEWSEVLSNHRAFLKDEHHKIFFLPSLKKGYIFSYAGGKFKLEKEIKSSQDSSRLDWLTPQIRRATYIDDYFYVISESEIIVLNENNWQEENKLPLR